MAYSKEIEDYILEILRESVSKSIDELFRPLRIKDIKEIIYANNFYFLYNYSEEIYKKCDKLYNVPQPKNIIFSYNLLTKQYQKRL